MSEQKITQGRLGQKLGIKQSAVSSLMSGKSVLSVYQLMRISELLGLKVDSLFKESERLTKRIQLMSREMESTLYQSELHLMCYCSAVKPIDHNWLRIEGYSAEDVEKSLLELVGIGILERNEEGLFLQKYARVSYKSQNRHLGSKVHQHIVMRSWKLFDRMLKNKSFLSDKFNFYMLDRFTKSQIKELDASLWQVYEKIQNFRQENMNNNYRSSESMKLWNFHLMMMTPCHLISESES